MRNLKRTLSLVMAMALIVGMMVVSASAVSSDFNDSAEITNTEAVDVMTAIGVFEGTDKGAFNPTGILTREQAAKIVAVMLLGEEDANKLSTNSTTFKDVAANRWSAGYIGYCVQQGILAGTGNGNFDPEGELTGLAFAKMMLVALGYDAKVANYVGNDWAINVAADAVNAGIAPKGIVLADAMTREQAAQMAFQTLTADMVYYTNKGTTVNTPDGTQVVVGASAPVKVANSKTDDYRTVSADRDEVQQFCEKYFSDLSVNNNGSDDFGRPSEQWKNGSKEIGTYASTADASYTEEVKSKTIYSDLGLGETTKADVIVDGKTAADFTVKKGDDTKLEASGNGVLVEAFVDSDDNVTLVVINTYVGEVSKVVDADSVKKDEEPYIEIAGLTGNGGKFETNASFDEDDVVLYTVADGDIQTVTMAKKIEDQEVTSKTGDTKFVADGETYKYNKNHRTYDITLKSSVDIYTDNYGYVVYVEEYEAGSASVAFVLNFKTNSEGWDGDTDKTYTAKLLLTDGTVIEADTDDKNPSTFKNKFVSYTVDDDGIYTLKAKDVTSDAGDSIYLTKGTSKFDINGTNNKGGERYANSSTIFLVYDEEEKEYSVYTGIANVPSMDGKATVYVNSKDGKPGSVAKYVFISAASDVVSDSNKAQIYILAGSQSKLISDSEKGDYYTYDAVIDGKITTVDVEKDYAEKNIKNDIVASRLTINSKDVVTKITEYENDTKKDDYYISGVGTKKTTDGTVGLTQNGSTTYYTYAKDVVVFRIEDDEFNTSSINSVRDSDDAFKAIVKDGEVVALFITENGKDGGKPDIKSDFKFDSISASREENGTVKVTASCADIDDWNLKDAVIEFTVSKNNGDEQTFTKNLSGVKSYADVMNALTVPGLTISANSTGTYDVSVLITFKDDNADTNTYTVSGSCSFTIA